MIHFSPINLERAELDSVHRIPNSYRDMSSFSTEKPSTVLKIKHAAAEFVHGGNWINRNHSHVLIPPEVFLIPMVLPDRKERSQLFSDALVHIRKRMRTVSVAHIVQCCTTESFCISYCCAPGLVV